MVRRRVHLYPYYAWYVAALADEGLQAGAPAEADLGQRFVNRRQLFRERGRDFRAGEYRIAPLHRDDAKAFVEQHHYSGSFPADRVSIGLLRRGKLVGAAVFSVPGGVSERQFFGSWLQPGIQAVDLGRFVLLDEVPFDAETWFLARAFEALPSAIPGIQAVTASSDPVPRLSQLTGERTTPGHVGTIYQAHNAAFLGRTTARTRYLDPLGVDVSPRGEQKLRKMEGGWKAVERRLLDVGADPRRRGETPGDWWRRVRQTDVFTRYRHPGNLMYAWPLLGKRERKALIRAAEQRRQWLGGPNPGEYPKGAEFGLGDGRDRGGRRSLSGMAALPFRRKTYTVRWGSKRRSSYDDPWELAQALADRGFGEIRLYRAEGDLVDGQLHARILKNGKPLQPADLEDLQDKMVVVLGY